MINLSGTGPWGRSGGGDGAADFDCLRSKRRRLQPDRSMKTEVREVATISEAREVVALALDHAAYGDDPTMPPDGPVATSEARDDAEVAITALMERPDLLVGLATLGMEQAE
jgi:hypothetical protein